ncbi:453_t:CDS:2, partial [Entrophospora sp. SA101]
MSTFSNIDYNAAYNAYLYNYHKSHNGSFDAALDVATGTGQVTQVLADSFKKVYGVDSSAIMLENAVKKSNITYSISIAENLNQFDDYSIDLLTVAEAAHWFDLPKFLEGSYRVLKLPSSPSGVVEKEGRLILENLYRGFEIPERLFKNVKFEIYDGTKESEQYRLMEADWTVSQFEKYLKTSSCYKTFSSKNPNAEDPVNKFMSRIKKVGGWEDNQLLKVIG